MLYFILFSFLFFFFNDTATTEIYTLSLHDALPISVVKFWSSAHGRTVANADEGRADQTAQLSQMTKDGRSEEHTSELQSQSNLVCRLLLEKKKKSHNTISLNYTYRLNSFFRHSLLR